MYSAEPSNPKPMQFDGPHLTAQEKQRGCCEHFSFYCGRADHIISHAQHSKVQCLARICLPLFVLQAELTYTNQSPVFSVLIESGSTDNFLDYTIGQRLHIPFMELSTPLAIHTTDGGFIGKGTITQCTPPLVLKVGSMHKESIRFLITNSTKHPNYFGLTLAQTAYPLISWDLLSGLITITLIVYRDPV